MRRTCGASRGSPGSLAAQKRLARDDKSNCATRFHVTSGEMAINGMLICYGLWAAFYLLWAILAARAKRTQSREGVGSSLSHRLPTIAAFCLLLIPRMGRGWLGLEIFAHSISIAVLGVAITAAGFAVAFWARAHLGGNWSSAVTVKVGHQLVRTGPYRWVRHPIYTGLLIAAVGTAIELRQLRGALALPLLYIGFRIKSKVEERAMTNTFGADYQEYQRSTGAIVPKLY
jgi:protein-S-isoprenylcysteine O-methyltransferase Ste14